MENYLADAIRKPTSPLKKLVVSHKRLVRTKLHIRIAILLYWHSWARGLYCHAVTRRQCGRCGYFSSSRRWRPKPQTIEAINPRKAKLPFVVAINKMDKPDADVEKEKGLSEVNLIPEDWEANYLCAYFAKANQHMMNSRHGVVSSWPAFKTRFKLTLPHRCRHYYWVTHR